MTAPALVQKLWNYCNILRDDGLSYGDYVEQLTLECSPKVDPGVMRVCGAEAPLTSNETKET